LDNEAYNALIPNKILTYFGRDLQQCHRPTIKQIDRPPRAM
jgi:hypothetical protein